MHHAKPSAHCILLLFTMRCLILGVHSTAGCQFCKNEPNAWVRTTFLVEPRPGQYVEACPRLRLCLKR